MPSKKKIRIFAGPNGSRKSTLFNEFSKNYNTGFFINADLLEKKLAESGLIDLREIGFIVTQKDLDNFKVLESSKTLFEKAEKEGHAIDIVIKPKLRIRDFKREFHLIIP